MKKLCYFILFLLISSSLFSQINQYGVPFISNYSAQNYTASEQNWDIVQDHRGVIYFGNNDHGVLEYDGVNWRKIPISNNSIVRSLAVDSKGIIYVGAQGEFGYLSPDVKGQLKYNSLINTLDTAQREFQDVWKTYIHNEGVYFCTNTKIFNYTNDTTISIKLKHGAFFSFYVNDKLYNGHYLNGLEVFTDSTFQLVKKGEFYSKKGIFSLDNFVEGSLLLGTFPQGLYTYILENGNTLEHFGNTPANKYLKENQLYNSCKINNNNYAFATINKGMIIMNKSGEIVDKYSKADGLQDETVISIYSNKGNFESPLWLALNNGIAKVEINSPFRKFGEEYGLNGSVYDIVRFNNTIFVATTLGVYYLEFDENNLPQFKKVRDIEDQTWSIVKYRIPKSDKYVLLAGTITGIYEIDENINVNYIDPNLRKIEEIELRNYVTKIKVSKFNKDEVYVGLVNAFFSIEYKNGTWNRKTSFEGVKDEIRKITEDDNGNIWLGTYYNGIIKIEKESGEITKYDEHDGLSDKKDIEICEVNDGLLFGTRNGVYRFNIDSKTFEIDKRFENDEQYGFFRLSPQNDSIIWISAFKDDQRWIELGIINDDELKVKKYPFLRLPNEQIDVIYHDIDGISWLGSSSGIYSYNNFFNKNYKVDYHALIRKISIIDDSVLFYGTNYRMDENSRMLIDFEQPDQLKSELEYNQNSLIFEYSATFFEEEAKTQYAYKLTGYKDSWSKWSTEPKAVFTNLSEGSYEFMVKANNIYETESKIASYEFHISPPWYRTFLAYIFYVIFAILIVYVIVKLYTRKLELEKIRLEGIVEERTTEIRNKNVELENKNEEITKQRDQIAKQKEHITDSIRYAQKIQQAVVPSEERKDELLQDHFLLWRPRDIVSGDFWWMTEKDNKVILAAADCTGHGVPGAFMSMLGVSFLNEIVNKLDEVHPHLILNQLRANVKSTLKQTGKEGEAKDGMDIALVIFDRDAMKMEYAGAYNPLFLYRNGELIETKADKNPIGIYIREKDSFTLHDIDLEKGDTIYIFSDGFVDQFGGPKKDKYKTKRFKQLLLDIQEKPMKEQGEILDKEIDDWRGDVEQIDDVIIIGVRF